MGQIGEDQPDGDYPQGVPQTQRKTPGKRDKEQADVTVMDTQAESKCADGAGIARRLQVEAEPAEHRERFERDGEDQAVAQHLPETHGRTVLQDFLEHAWPAMKKSSRERPCCSWLLNPNGSLRSPLGLKPLTTHLTLPSNGAARRRSSRLA